MKPDPSPDAKIVHKVVCPICGTEGELFLPPRDADRCVALQRIRCDSCGIERTLFLEFPDGGDVGTTVVCRDEGWP